MDVDEASRLRVGRVADPAVEVRPERILEYSVAISGLIDRLVHDRPGMEATLERLARGARGVDRRRAGDQAGQSLNVG